MSYARYTEFTYDPERRDEVLAYWRHPDTPHPTSQPGFERGFVFDSIETPGVIRVVTMWREPHHFDAYYATPGHQGIVRRLSESSARTTVRDGLEAQVVLVPPAEPRDGAGGHVRVIRARILDDSRIPELVEFWRTRGRAALEAAEGNHAARAYIDDAAGLFIIQVWWQTEEAAIAFVASDEHHEQLTVPLAQWVEKLDRADARPLD